MYLNFKGKKTWVNLDRYDYDIDYSVLQTEIQKVIDSDAETGYNDVDIGAETNSLPTMFTWGKTPQGEEFWSDIRYRRSASNRVRLIVEDTIMAQKLVRYFGDLYCDNVISIKNKSNKYGRYEWSGGVLKGYKEDDTTSCLKLHTFLKNRDLPEEIIQECIKILKANREYEWRYDTLSDGYQTTQIHSCMRGNGSYYYKFDDHGKLLQAYLNAEEVGRAIVWHKVEGLPDGCLGFMDRIYPSDNHAIVDAFKDYAKRNSLMYKQQQSYSCDNRFVWCGVDVELSDLELHIGDLEDCDTPYMDTFRYYRDGVLYNKSSRAKYTLGQTDGEATYNSGNCCHCCGTRYDSDELTYSEHLDGYLCDDCYNESHCGCERCGEYGHRYTMPQTAYDYICERCAQRDYIYCENEGYYVSTDEVLYCEDTNDYIPSNCAYYYSDYSETYSYERSTVEVTDERGNSLQWFEDEAEENAYKHSDGEYYTYEEETDEND